MKKDPSKTPLPKGPLFHRLLVRLLTFAFAVLVFWLLGFLVNDIRSLPGPDMSAIEKEHVEAELSHRRDDLEQRIGALSRRIDDQAERQRVVEDSSRNLQQTINQILELQRLSLQHGAGVSEAERVNLGDSLTVFLENQKRYQELSQEASELIEQRQILIRERMEVDVQLSGQRELARADFLHQRDRHRLKLAFFQLGILLPILLTAVAVSWRFRGNIYFPLFLAFSLATLLRVTLVAHEYFPTRFFKYILIGVLLLVVARVLIHFIRATAFPKTQWLLKQYREAYERFLCPVCEYPIRTGPRRYLFWTRRTVHKVVLSSGEGDREETYICPSCGHSLFEECEICHKVRHSLLPACSHCGGAKEEAPASPPTP